MYRLPSDYDSKAPRVTVTELSLSPSVKPKTSKVSTVAYIEHNEFIEVVQSPRKKGFVSFFKNLNGPAKASSRARIPPSTEKHGRASQKHESLGISHDRVEALMGKPKDSLATSPSLRSDDIRPHSLTKTELQSMFSGAPCFNISETDGKLHSQINTMDNIHEPQAACNEPGTITSEQFLQHQSNRDHDLHRLTTDDVLDRVLKTFGARKEISHQALNAVNNAVLDLSATPVTRAVSPAVPTAPYAANIDTCSHPFGSAYNPGRGDFTTPTESLPVLGNEACFDGVAQTKSIRSSNSTPAMIFSSPINSKLQPLELPLSHSVDFVSSHPCYPVLKPLASQPKAQGTVDGWGDCLPSDFLASGDEDRAVSPTDSACSIPAWPPSNKASPGVTGGEALAHPLYNGYQYEVVPGALLLSMLDVVNGLLHAEGTAPVVVLDCRGSTDLGLLAGAWCAQMGEHAVVAKVGRTCLACSVRQARALGIRIVIRL